MNKQQNTQQPEPSCQHRIADARNPVVTSSYLCVDCGALFSAADHGEPKQPEPVNQQTLAALKALYRGYVSTLESGRDRIVSLGGQCDAVDVMERSDPVLRDASYAIAAAEAAQPVATFKYKIDYVAAWLSERSIKLLQEAGIIKLPHLTTFFDGYGQLSSMTPYKWDGKKTAKIAKVVEWPVGNTLYLIAELDCGWSAEINAHYLQQGAREDLPHKPHITLAKRVPQGEAEKFQHLVGIELEFVRHGAEQPASAQPVAVPDGWQLVPKEPTPEMLEAAWQYHGSVAYNELRPDSETDAERYRAMLSAAQKPEGV